MISIIIDVGGLLFIVLFLQFPFCDGTHNTHNKETGDNIGPLVVKCNKEEKKKSK
jgi:hypothetical protein